jgi:hypothetical protein
MQLYRHVTANHVALSPMPFQRELSMEAYLIENPDILALDEDDLAEVTIVEAEVALPGGRQSKQGDGRIDLVAIYGDSTAGIVELKLGELNGYHLKQLEDYLAKAHAIMPLLRDHLEKEDPKLIGLLVGTAITQELRSRIENGYLVHETIPVAALTLSRYRGNDNNLYVVTDTFFRNESRKFDKTKYRFASGIYGKNRLVLAVIREYVEEHPGITLANLSKAFPKELQGWSGCFDTIENAKHLADSTGHKRHFLKPDETIELNDSQIAVSSQWGIGNIGRFLENAKKLGVSISTAEIGRAHV